MKMWVVAAAVAGGLAAGQARGEERPWRGPDYYPGAPPGYGAPSEELSVEQQRKMGLSDEQVQKIAELRRELERERARLDVQLKAAQQAAMAANAEVSRLSRELYALTGARLAKVYESVMTKAQLEAWRKQRYLGQAKQWLAGYRHWLKLSDAQVEDIAGLLVPIYEKYATADDRAAAASERLAELRRAEKPDVAAIEKAEKELAELSKVNVWQARHNDMMDRMRPGLLPDQLEKLDKMYRPHR